MIDRYALRLLSPFIELAARHLNRMGISADQMTFIGFGFGMLAAALIAAGEPLLALLPLLAGRACDGLDGALARLTRSTDRGAFLDIALDFLFYASVPLAFAIADPDANALAAAVLLAAFMGTGASFLAFAIIAEKRKLKTSAYPSKAFYYLGGLAEGGETIICFVAMCIWPEYFAIIAVLYAAMCAVTTITRLAAGWRSFSSTDD
jgi:phosphatidylglycerophosphate synthase